MMHVAHCGIGCDESVAPRTAWMIRNVRALRFNYLGQELCSVRNDLMNCSPEIHAYTHLFVDISGWEISLEPALWIFVLIVVNQSKRLLDLIILVVASVNNDARMMP